MSEILRLESVSAAYGKVVALHDVTMSVEEGEIIAILGANGAGKTTLLNVVSGVMPALQGVVYFNGQRINGLKPWQLARIGISHIPEGREIFPSMSVLGNLRVVDVDGGGPTFSVDAILDMFPRLRERIDQSAGNLSGGEQQMLAIGRGLMARPRLILFDEPSLGLSPVLTKFVIESIARLRDEGMTSVLVEQNMRAALRIADRAHVLRVGKVVRSGPAQELANAPDIQEAYLGV